MARVLIIIVVFAAFGASSLAQSVFRRPIMPPASSPITLVNTAVDEGSASATTVAAPATSLTAGNLLVVTARSAGITISGVADTAGNTYTRITGVITTGATPHHLDLWYAQNTLGNASNVVTVTFSSSAATRSVITAQYSGLKTTGALDVSATGLSSGVSVTSGNYTTTQADELIVAGVNSETTGNSWTPGSGFTLRATGDSKIQYIDRTVSTIQTAQHASMTGSIDSAKGIVVATFKKL